MNPFRPLLLVLISLLAVPACGQPSPVADAANAGGTETPFSHALRCPRPADPRSRHFECKAAAFDAIEESLGGDWNRARIDMARIGITPTASYSGAFFAAASGPGTAPTYAGQLTGSVNIELDKLAGAWSGLSFYLSASWASQTHADSFLNASVFSVNSLAAGNAGRLGEMYVQQSVLSGKLVVAGGWLAPAATFASLPVLANYLGTAFATNPVALTLNDPPFGPVPPNSQWGVQALYDLAPAWQLAGGVFNNNPNAASGAKRGANFALREGNTGALAVGQWRYLHNHGAGDAGLPGQYVIGALYDGNAVPDLATGARSDGNWNFFALAQQQVTRAGGPDSTTGVTLWGGIAYAPSQRINPLPLELGTGASWRGPLAGRPQDVASVGAFYGRVSATPPGTTATGALELNYQYAATRAVTLIGDIQYLWRLNGLPSPGAAVLGAQVNVVF